MQAHRGSPKHQWLIPSAPNKANVCSVQKISGLHTSDHCLSSVVFVIFSHHECECVSHSPIFMTHFKSQNQPLLISHKASVTVVPTMWYHKKKQTGCNYSDKIILFRCHYVYFFRAGCPLLAWRYVSYSSWIFYVNDPLFGYRKRYSCRKECSCWNKGTFICTAWRPSRESNYCQNKFQKLSPNQKYSC